MIKRMLVIWVACGLLAVVFSFLAELMKWGV